MVIINPVSNLDSNREDTLILSKSFTLIYLNKLFH